MEITVEEGVATGRGGEEHGDDKVLWGVAGAKGKGLSH